MPKAADWEDLNAELELWHQAGRTATFWWRDDDAITATPQLQKLLGLTAEHGVAPALAVIPAGAGEALAEQVRDAQVDILQHGFDHANHAAPQEKKIELGPHRDRQTITRQLASGWQRLRELFESPLPVLVPPWNRIDPTLLAELPQLGLTGLSRFAPRAQAFDLHGLQHINTHVDIVAWQHGRRFCGQGAALAQAVAHLRARRQAQVDAVEPTGLMTHHLIHEDAAWTFCRRLLEVTTAHPAARWLRAKDVF